MKKIKLDLTEVETKIFIVRGERVLLGPDLAKLYQVPTKRLNEQVKRNIKRFPSDFMFILSDHELRNLRSQFATSSLDGTETWGGSRIPPLAFTEQGVAMLSTVLNSKRAIEVNIAIMRTFIRLRRVLISDPEFGKRIVELEKKYDHRFKVVFDALRELSSSRPVPSKRILGLG